MRAGRAPAVRDTHTPRGATGATMSTKLRPFYSRAQPGLLLCFHYDCVERVRLPRQSRRVLLQQKKTTMAARRGSRRARTSARSGRRREQAGGWYRRAPGRGVAVAAVVMHSSLVCVIQVWHATAEHPAGREGGGLESTQWRWVWLWAARVALVASSGTQERKSSPESERTATRQGQDW